ncbi:N-acyl-D-amino-acid deacylase family protein [Steroidobacter agaridevorans]|uniref:N-acyl-D-amino-acid deacylase family protein n=1 Tax=Steroidobacter agaridevorans TaxID=2695856 RepID=UPI0013227A59|nr:D-aminoacylase [Steroidobacter agaridevorans]GFE86853.1 D-aminoacylase [Steroidobacter agaridevorans]
MKKLLALLLATSPTLAFAAAAPNLDSAVISNVSIVDGTGAPARKGSVRIADGKILAVGDLIPGNTEIVIDGNGKTLAPGFIDTHSHHDYDIPQSPDMVAVTSQGVTTIIVGQDGSSQSPLRDFFGKLEKNPIAVNLGSYSGHNTLREQGMNAARRPATDAEIARMSQLLEEDMAAGAFGLSTGLQYETGNFSNTAEIVALAKVSARLGGRYISHMRNEESELMSALQETIDIGREAGAPVQVSHLKIGAKKLWGTADKVLQLMDDARASGVDITADIYPYTYWQSTMRVMFPNGIYDDRKALESKLKESTSPEGLYFSRFQPDPAIVGKSLAQVAKERNATPVNVYLALMKQAIEYQAAHPEDERVESVIGASMREDDVARLMAWEHANICSDGVSIGHPRGHGTFPRVLGHYVREKKAMTLEQGVYKMTGLAAKHLGIADRGVIAEGNSADLVLFDPTTIIDRATMQNPTALSAGVEKVWVNGKLVYQDRRTTGVRPGQIVRPPKKAE